jgi:hypothetical protein
MDSLDWVSACSLKSLWADGDLIVNGNLGVGTSTPQAKLDVNGAIRTGAGQNFKIRYGSGSVVFSSNLLAHTTATYGTVSFGHRFSSAPTVIITGTQNTALVILGLIAHAQDITVDGFTLRLYNAHSAGTGTSTPYNYNWVAIGE